MDRRTFLSRLGAGAAVAAAWPLRAAPSEIEPAGLAGRSGKALGEPAFRPLPLGTVKPEGWLLRQLRLQADGLSGHLDEFWPDVAHSQWFGGKAEGWERAPYWLDGVIPLAWVLGDEALQRRCKRYIDYIVSHQRPDGWFSPYPTDPKAKPYDVWSILLANKVLVQYHEATKDLLVLESVLRNLKAVAQSLERKPLFDWGRFRWFEGLIPVFYTYEALRDDWLLDLARKLREQGFDYQQFYASEEITRPTPRRGKWTWEKHVVNTAMALKAYALSWRLTGSEAERAFPAKMLEILDRYHGQVTGMFTGDECLSGKNPVQGTELCAVVEALYSLEHLVSITGEPGYADRLERIAFNALPATFAPDMWSHQYDQQVNQVQCTINPDHMWSTNGPESNIYGLEPNYGCCTANMHQGWPKLAAHLWMRTPDEGLALVAYAPSSAQCDVRGTPVRVSLNTEYPFRETLTVTVKASAPVHFPLLLRVPAWAEDATLRAPGGPEVRLTPGTFHRLEQEWRGDTELQLRFPMKVATSRRYNDAIAIERGPLVYSLKLGETRTRVNADKPHRDLPHGDFEVRPTTPWNYALLIDEAKPEASVTFQEQPVGARPFSPEGAGMVGKVKGRKLPAWKLQHGWAGDVPAGEQTSDEPLEDLTLIPYGCTNIRVTEFPRLKDT
ncbi:MAG: beta-L-arabinofuranosidase domain-containing protein [Verrucomicrobiia bacterium]